jgi:hypothetical protein
MTTISQIIKDINNNELVANFIDDNIIFLKDIIVINNESELKNIFTNSKIIKCFINGIEFNKLKYNSIIYRLYHLINNTNKIKFYSLLKIIDGEKNINGYKYIKNLNISVQGNDSNKCIKEIFKQSTNNNINIIISIQFHNKKIVNYIF